MTEKFTCGPTMNAQYFGISGAYDTATWTGPGNQSLTINGRPLYFSDRGMISSYNFVKIRDCLDGTSNTLMVGEVSSMIKDSTGASIDARPGVVSGGWIFGNIVPEAGSTSASTLVINYAPNSASAGMPGVIFQYLGSSDDRYRLNTPLASSHTGGANVLKTDGSVIFVSNSINLDTLKYLAARDDGQPISE